MIKILLVASLTFSIPVAAQTLSAGYLYQVTNDKDLRNRHGVFSEMYFTHTNHLFGSNLSVSFADHSYNTYSSVNGSFTKTDTVNTEKTSLTYLHLFYCKRIVDSRLLKIYFGPQLGLTYSISTDGVNSFRPLNGLKLKACSKDFFNQRLGFDLGISPGFLIKMGELLDASYALSETNLVLGITAGLRYKF